jgi:hypothetical protein
MSCQPDPLGPRGGVGDEIARRKPQFVQASINLFREIANVLQPLQLGKG